MHTQFTHFYGGLTPAWVRRHQLSYSRS